MHYNSVKEFYNESSFAYKSFNQRSLVNAIPDAGGADNDGRWVQVQ